jgi:hypothetical protein
MTRIRMGMLAVVWLSLGLVGAGGINAENRALFANLHQSPSRAASDQSRALIFVFFGPVSLIVGSFMTGFFYHGWSLSRATEPCTSKYPEIWCKP